MIMICIYIYGICTYMNICVLSQCVRGSWVLTYGYPSLQELLKGLHPRPEPNFHSVLLRTKNGQNHPEIQGQRQIKLFPSLATSRFHIPWFLHKYQPYCEIIWNGILMVYGSIYGWPAPQQITEAAGCWSIPSAEDLETAVMTWEKDEPLEKIWETDVKKNVISMLYLCCIHDISILYLYYIHDVSMSYLCCVHVISI